jgi:hypothetical protein
MMATITVALVTATPTWTAQAYVKPANAGAGDGFEEAVALSSDTLAVGASSEAGCGTSIVNGASGYDTANGCRGAGAVYGYVPPPARTRAPAPPGGTLAAHGRHGSPRVRRRRKRARPAV